MKILECFGVVDSGGLVLCSVRMSDGDVEDIWVDKESVIWNEWVG